MCTMKQVKPYPKNTLCLNFSSFSFSGRKLKRQSKHNISQSRHAAHFWEPLYLLLEWPEQRTSLCSQLYSKYRKRPGLSKVCCPASRKGTIQGKAECRSWSEKTLFLKEGDLLWKKVSIDNTDNIGCHKACGLLW